MAPILDQKQAGEYHLFIIWETARSHEAQILEHVRQKFEIAAVREVHWSARRVSDNFTRFYGEKLPSGSFKEEHCGKGPFLAILVCDASPCYQDRQTSKGQRSVNINTFDAKQQFRQWTGGGHRIHATDTEDETRHDVALLFSASLAELVAARTGPWNGAMDVLKADLAGADGWKSLQEFFTIVNETICYTALRHFERLPGHYDPKTQGDIDLLTNAPDAAVGFIVNGKKVHPHCVVPVGGQDVLFEIRCSDEAYYDPKWQKDILARRIQMESGIHVPTTEDYFYSLLAHTLLFKKTANDKNVNRLRDLGTELGLEWTRDLKFIPRVWLSALQAWLHEKGYEIVRPHDPSVFFNEAVLEGNLQWEAIHQGLPLACPMEQLISARLLVEHEGKKYFSCVFDQPAAQRVIKQATDDLAQRDAKFLELLTGPFFPRVISTEQHDGWSVAHIERIDGEPLLDFAKKFARAPQGLVPFFHDCLNALAQLQTAGILHRDIRPDNILVRAGRPVLIDFGWAISDAQPGWTPGGLGQEGCPADRIYCDVFAMGKTFEKILPPGERWFAPLVAVMTAEDRAARVVSIPALKCLLQSLQPPSIEPANGGSSATTSLSSLRGPQPLKVFPVQTRAAFEQMYRDWLAPTLDGQRRFAPDEQKPFTLPGHCAVCGSQQQFMTDFLYAAPDSKGRLQPSWRERQICACKLNSRQRACFHVLAEGFKFAESARIYCTEQASPLFARIKERFPFTIGSEFLGEKTPLGGQNFAGIRNEDLTRLTFPDDSFDCIVCLEVLEHVPNHAAALSELARCLRPGGALLLTTPIHFNKDKTVVRASIGPDGNLIHHCPPVYHGDPINASGALCFNDFGWDLLQDLQKAGFDDPTLNFFSSEDYGYLGTQCVVLASRAAVLPAPSAPRKPRFAANPAPAKSVLETESTDILLQRVASLCRESKWVEATPVYQILTRRLPDDLNLWRQRIACSQNAGHKFLANLVSQDALRLHPEWAAALVHKPVPVVSSVGETKPKGAVPAVSIIIPVLNKIELTSKCLAALKKNTPAELYEVIVWDNASTDGTRAFFEQSTTAEHSVRYFRSEENLGFVGGNNAAVQQARGRFLVFLNNDTEPQAGWLQALLQTIESSPKAGAVGAKLIYPNGKLQEAGGIIFRDASGWNYGRMEDPRDPRFNFPREVDYCSAACLLVRSELFGQLGGFDSRYAPAYYEDTDLCFGLRQAGYKVLYQPRCEIIHHEGATAGQDLNKGFKQYQTINREKFFRKWEKALAQQRPPDPAVVRRASDRASGERILVVDPMLPMYDRASGSKRLFEMLKLLAGAGHAVTFVARNGQNGERYAAELAQLGIEVYAGDAEGMKECGFEVNCWPFDLKKLLQDSQYDTVVLCFWYIAEQYLNRIRSWSPKSRIVIDTVDVHFLREIRHAELEQNEKLLEQAKEKQRRELKVYRKADALITVTEDDRQTLREKLPEITIFVVPNIHDLATEVPPVNNRSNLLFVGGFGHPPNVDAVLYFHREIWPRVVRRVPKARWTIVGNNPPASVQALASATIQVTGYVPSMEPYLRSHLISIAPLRYGAGMKGKIGEALASGLPVVTTSIGAEGMGLKDGSGGALVADDPEAFAAHVANLYTNRDLWNQLSKQGRQHIESNFTPACIKRNLDTFLNRSAACASIIVLVHNQWEHTEKCLESITRHTPEEHEIIVVDNGSTDQTPGALRSMAAKNPRLRVIVNQDNRGFAAGNNQGLAIARGGIIVLLNNDTVVTPGWLTRLVATLERHPDTGIVGPMSNRVSGPQLVPSVNYTDLAGLPAFAESWAQEHDGQSFELPRAVGFCLLARREVIDRIGGLDECFGSGNFEDDDFCIRTQLAGFRVRVAQDAFIHHEGGQTFKGARINYGASLSRNWQIFKSKWGMPKDLKMEKGYRLPDALPAGCPLQIPLPAMVLSHKLSLEGRWWTDKKLKSGAIGKSVAAQIKLPPCALLGNLTGARELLHRKQHGAAWQAAISALSVRPFHPEARLLLAEIALAAGAGDIARQCAQTARQLAPDWSAVKKFLKGALRGQLQPEWFTPPPAPSSTPRLSVCLIVKNEEKFLGQCLKSIRDIATQIVVVDTGSTDNTMAIAKEHGAEVHQFAWCDDFSAARNAALEHATGDWVLSLDADEELLPEHQDTLRREIQAAAAMAYRLPIIDKGREQEGCSYVPRLFRNAPGLFFLGRVHEQAFSSIEVRCQQWSLKHLLGQTALLHHGYTAEIVSKRDKVERNLRLLERAIEELPDEPNLLMNYGLELTRSGQLQDGLEQYAEAIRCAAERPPSEVTPELRETLLTQLTTHLMSAKMYGDIVHLWQTTFAKSGSMTASQHFSLGLAYMELQKAAPAAEQMRQCLAKREAPTLSPKNPAMLKGGPAHCLALCLAKLQQPAAAADSFRSAIDADPKARPPRFDFARFLAETGKPIDALKWLNELVSENAADLEAWFLGGKLALSKPEFRAFACDWTGEAVKNFSADPAILLQRAEALFLAERMDLALPFWRSAVLPKNPRANAARVLCEILQDDCQFEVCASEEPALSQEALKWYRRLIAVGATGAVQRLHQKIEAIRLILPGFVSVWETATRKVATAVTA